MNGELTIPITLTDGGTDSTIYVEDGAAAGTSNVFRVTQRDGAGTMTVSPTWARYNSAGNTLTFTYTPGPGGMLNGSVTVDLPTGWSPSSAAQGSPGYVTSSDGSVAAFGPTISRERARPRGRQQLHASSTASRAPVRVARPGCDGADDRPAPLRGTRGARDRRRTCSSCSASRPRSQCSPRTARAASPHRRLPRRPRFRHRLLGNTITFTYTAATGGMQNGTITLAVPERLVGSVHASRPTPATRPLRRRRGRSRWALPAAPSPSRGSR